MNIKIVLSVLLSSFFLTSSSLCLAAGSITLDDRGNGVYVINANGLVNVDGVSVNLTYDRNILSNPRIERGVGNWTLFFPSTEKPGVVTVVALSTTPVSVNGQFATVRFDKKGTVRTTVAFTSEIVDSAGTTQKGSGAADTGTETESGALAGETSGTADTAGTGGSTGTSGSTGTVGTTGATGATGTTDTGIMTGTSGTTGTGTTTTVGDGYGAGTMAVTGLPGPEPAPPAPPAPQQSEPTLPPLQAEPEPPAPEEEGELPDSPGYEHRAPTLPAARVPESKYVVYKGVLDRFKVFAEEKKSQSLMALFAEPVAATITQDPAICLSDGKNTVRITVDLGENGVAPNFALRGASMKSLGKDGSKWVVVALPQARRFDATLTVMVGERVIDYPLTIAPPVDVNIDKSDAPGENDFNLFLKEKGTDKASRFDLNGDGKRDYVDEFIFTANYLVAGNTAKGKAK